MKRNQKSIDGFTPRRRTNPESIKKVAEVKKSPANISKRRIEASKNLEKLEKQKVKSSPEKIEEALYNLEIEQENSAKEKSKAQKKLEKINEKRRRKGKKPMSISGFWARKIVRFAILGAFLFGLIYVGPKIVSSISSFLHLAGSGNVFDVFNKQKLKEDADGRTNILIFGTSPEGWDGEDLTDSVILVSVNQESKQARTISMPRDLWVRHKCPNWLGTTAGKLNESYGCGKFSEGIFEAKNATSEQKNRAEKLGQDEISGAVAKITGLDVHYVVHANWQVLVQTIDALGGIDVKIEVWDGSAEMYDYATKIRYKNGETVHMNGQQALAFSRARGSQGGIGFSGGNFDRERNQQKIIQATAQKIKDSKFNLDALTKVAAAMGDNIKTTFEVKEFQTLLDLAQNFNSSNIKSLPLMDETNGIELLTTDMIGDASVVVPSAGIFEYSRIQAYISKHTKDSGILAENAKIVILNGTEISGLAGEKQRKLSKDGFNITEIDSAPTSDYSNTKLYKASENNPQTSKKLAEKLNATAENLPRELEKWREKADFVIVLGED